MFWGILSSYVANPICQFNVKSRNIADEDRDRWVGNVTAHNSCLHSYRSSFFPPLFLRSLLYYLFPSLSLRWLVDRGVGMPTGAATLKSIVKTGNREWLVWLSLTLWYLSWSSPTPIRWIVESLTGISALANAVNSWILNDSLSLSRSSAIPCLHLWTLPLHRSSSTLFSSTTRTGSSQFILAL